MKRGLIIFLIVTICLTEISLANSKKSKSKKYKHTPQGTDLKNHFGAPSIASPFGPKHDPYAQYVEANPDTFLPFKTDGKKLIEKKLEFKPYPGYENKLNPHIIKSGDMTNIAPSASKIIKPEIAVPKLNIRAEVEYPAVVAMPTFKGMKKEYHDFTAYNKETGAIEHGKALIERPNYVMENQVMNIQHPHEESINLKTGERIKKDENKISHGIDMN
jgi:hypothetical protein